MIVYTAIIGSGRDQLRPIVAPADPTGRPVQYVCFGNAASINAPPGWEVRAPVWKHVVDSRRTARWHKAMAHVSLGESVQYSLWHDGTQQLLVNPWELVDRYLADREMAVFRHHERVCAYQEMEMCERLGRDDPGTMRKQMDRYREEGYPARRGLWEMGIFLRAHSTAVRKFNEVWWREIEYGSVRDQLSVNYAAWKLGMAAACFPGTVFRNPYFTFHQHQAF